MQIKTEYKLNNIKFGSYKNIPTKISKIELYNKSENLNNEIRAIIESAIKTKTPINKRDIANMLGIKYEAITARIIGNPTLKELMEQTIFRYPKTGPTKKEQNNIPKTNRKTLIKELINTIKTLLQNAVNSGQAINSNDIITQVNIKPERFFNHIKKNPELKELWEKVQRRNRTFDSVDIENNLKFLLEEINAKEEYLNIDDIAAQVKLTPFACKSRINRNPSLLNLWEKIKNRNPNKGGLKPTLEDSIKINQKINYILTDIINNNEAVTINDVIKRLEIKSTVFLNRIQANPELLELWTKVRQIHEKNDLELVENLRKTLENAINTGESLTAPMLKKRFNISSDVLYKRFERYPDLRNLWDKIPHNTTKKKESAKDCIKKESHIPIKKLQPIYDQVQKILESAIANNTPITQKEIAELVGVKTYNLKSAIARTPILKELWSKITPKKRSDKSIQTNNILAEKLLETISSKENLSQNKLAKFADITQNNCFARLRRTPELADLWAKLKQNKIEDLKTIQLLKSQGYSDSEIMTKLNISKEAFENINSEYKKIETLISTHQDKNISQEEYLKWATLSKQEFEIVVTNLFKKMGYEAQTTQYFADSGIDIIAEKDGKTVYIECVHNLQKGVKAIEILELQGCKKYHDTDEVILVASSGAQKSAQKVLNMLNVNINDKFKLLNLEDIIKLSKKHNVKPEVTENTQFADFENTLSGEKTWILKDEYFVTKEDINNIKTLNQEDYNKKCCEIFEKQGYNVTQIPATFLKNTFLLEKDAKKTILLNSRANILPIQQIRALYGLKDCLGADNVILAGITKLSTASKKYIEKINQTYPETYKIISLNSIINLFKN